MGMVLKMEMAAGGEAPGQRWGKRHRVQQRKPVKKHREKRLLCPVAEYLFPVVLTK